MTDVTLGTKACLAVIGYTYVGYPLLVVAAARVRERRRGRAVPVRRDPPTMTVLVPAYNEAGVIDGKIRDALAQDYPPDKLDVVVVADGSDDGTARIARRRGVTVLWQPQREGKSAAVNRGMAAATGDLVCLTDANCRLTPGSLRALADAFVDPAVAVVSGAKTVSGDGAKGAGEGLYWRVEARQKQAESTFGCTMGAPGEICGIRHSAFRHIPPGIVTDDFYIACDALVRGLQVRYTSGAVAAEEVSPTLADEFERRARIGAGTWQTTLGHLCLADPRRGWTAFAFVSHRLLRNVVVPPLLPLLGLVSARNAMRGRDTRMILEAQAVVYLAAAIGAISDSPVVAAPFQFVLMNLATLRGAARFLTRRQPSAWRKVGRTHAR